MYSSALVYLMAIVGGYVADTFWGKYKTIMYFSICYCIGSFTLAASSLFSSVPGCLLALCIIAVGTGGIKPNVSSFGADQYRSDDKAEVSRYFMAFYFCINTGSVGSTFLTPLVRKFFGYFFAFLLPCVLLVVATYLFWRARRRYVHTPMAGSPFVRVWNVVQTARRVRAGTLHSVDAGTVLEEDPNQQRHWYECATGHEGCDHDAVSEAVAVARIGEVFLCLPTFWMLFDQQGSAWTLQAKKMDMHGFMEAEQIGILNPLIVLFMIPLFNRWVYPLAEQKMGGRLTSLGKMRCGMFVAAVSFLVTALVQSIVESSPPSSVTVFMQIPQYLVMTVAEILVSVAGLEFAYENAPTTMKSTIMSMFLLATAVGDVMGGLIYTILGNLPPVWLYVIFSVLMVLNACVFIRLSGRFVPYTPPKITADATEVKGHNGKAEDAFFTPLLDDGFATDTGVKE